MEGEMGDSILCPSEGPARPQNFFMSLIKGSKKAFFPRRPEVKSGADDGLRRRRYERP